jgi:hypothetical protein
VIGSLFVVGQTWSYGSSLFAWTVDQLGDAPARILAAGVAIAGLVASGWLGRRGQPRIGVLVALSAPLAASPVFFPWYPMPIIPILALEPALPLTFWVLTQPLTYASAGWDGALWALVSWFSLAALLWAGRAVLGREERPAQSEPAQPARPALECRATSPSEAC